MSKYNNFEKVFNCKCVFGYCSKYWYILLRFTFNNSLTLVKLLVSHFHTKPDPMILIIKIKYFTKHSKPALQSLIKNLSIVFIYMSYSWVVCQRGVSRGGTRGVGMGAGDGAGSGRGSVRRCWSGIPHRTSTPLRVEPRGNVHEPLAKRAGGGIPDVAFCGQNIL